MFTALRAFEHYRVSTAWLPEPIQFAKALQHFSRVSTRWNVTALYTLAYMNNPANPLKRPLEEPKQPVPPEQPTDPKLEEQWAVY